MNYAVIEHGLCTNVVVCDDPEFAAEEGWVPLEGLDPMPWIGWAYDGEAWTPPPEVDPRDGP